MNPGPMGWLPLASPLGVVGSSDKWIVQRDLVQTLPASERAKTVDLGAKFHAQGIVQD